MTDPEEARRLIAYNQWGNERVLAAVDGLGADELERPREAYFGSLAAGLWHVVGAQNRWLARWKGTPLPGAQRPAGLSWPALYAESHAALRDYVAPLTGADLGRVVRYTLATGETSAQPLGSLVVHVANHSTQHRAELGLVLERIGRSPGDLDYVRFLNLASVSPTGS